MVEEKKSMSKSLPENLPVGFRFSPTDEELINHYLMLKMIGKDSEVDYVIPEIDFCSYDPWELPFESKIKSDDQIWWFLCKRDYKNPRSKRAKRTTKSGFWKITGTEQEIKDSAGKACIATKKILVFRTGPSPGQKTDWVMHEYYPYPENHLPHQRDYVICRFENKSNEKVSTRGCDDREPSGDIVSVCDTDIENPVENKGDEKAGTVGCDKGEPSGDIISVSDFENPVATAILEVHDHVDWNADSLSPLHFSLDRCITMENIGLNFKDSFDDGTNTNFKHHPEPENAQTGPPGYDKGEASSNITSAVENPVLHAAISEVCGHAEGSADSLSEQLFSLDWCITMEDLDLNFEDSFDDGQNINYKHHPALENAQPGPPGFDKGEASGNNTSIVENPVSHAAISEVHGHAEGNADSLSEQLFSPDCCITMEDLGLNFEDGFDDGQNINYMHHPEPENAQPGPPGFDEGEANGNNTSIVKNPVSHAAISGVHGGAEGNADFLLQPLFSPDCYCTMEDLGLNFEDSFDDGRNINYEHHPEPENAQTGPPGCDEGEASSDVTSNVGNPLSHAAISEERGHAEGNADLLAEPIFSPDYYLAMENIDGVDDGQNVNYEHHPEPENSLPHQNPHLTCCLENKTDEKAGTPGCNKGEPSVNITCDVENQVVPTAILVVHGHKEVNAKTPLLSPDCYPTQKDISSNFSNGFSDDNALRGADETEESPVEFLDGLAFAPCKNYYEETTNKFFNDSVRPKSLKRPYVMDIPASDDTNLGVDGRVKRSCSLGLGE